VLQRFRFAVVLLLGCAVASAQVKPLPSKLRISDTELARCDDAVTGRSSGGEVVRSHVLVSPGGRYRAYTEVQAVASSDESCSSTSRLFVAEEDRPFRQVLIVKPSLEALGNTLGLVDWSPDGNNLLFTEGIFQWGTDSAENFIRFFDAGRATFSGENFIAKAFRNHLNKTCISVLEPKGFALDGGIVLGAAPSFAEGEDQPEEDSCVRQKGLWVFEPKGQNWSTLPEKYEVQRFGKYLIGDQTGGMGSSATHGAGQPADRPASHDAPAQSTPPTPPPLTIRRSPRK